MKFDVIVGNPPYQHPTNKNRAHPIWALLLEKSFSLLKEGGFLAYITPDSWRTPSSKLTKYFTSYKLLWLYLDAKKYFRKINSKFSVYVIKKEKSYDGYETAVISNGSSSKFNLFGLDFIPEISKVAFKLVSEFSKKPKMQLQSVGNPWRSDTNWNVSDIKDKIFKYELFHIHKKNLYAKTKHPLQTTKKVILNKTGTWNPFYSDSLGFTHIHLARVVSTAEEGKLVEQYLNSDILKFYIKIMNIFGARDKFTMDNIPEMPIDYSNNYNLYKYFNLTREEIDYIESHI